MPLVLAVDEAYAEARRGSRLSDRARLLPRTLCRTAEPPLFRRTADPPFRWRQALSEARRAQPYRRAQDQQLPGASAAGAPHEEAPDHRRDGRRPARRRDGDGLRALRYPLRRLYGPHRHRAAKAQRLPHEIARRRGGAGAFGDRDPEGCDERGFARLGRACRRHVLRDRHGCRTAPLPDDGAGLPVGHRARDAGAARKGRRPAPRYIGRLHRGRLERDGLVSSFS